jgi:CheY-like chemotaxis protein
LLVEDDQDTRETIMALLEGEGYSIKSSANFEEARQLLETDGFSLVIADYLFGSPGVPEARAAALLDAARPVPVGCITSWAVPADLRQRFAFLLTKPFDLDDLLGAVEPLAGVGREDAAQSETIRAYFRALSRADWGALAALCIDSVRYNLPARDTIGATIEGRARFIRYAEELFSLYPGTVFEVLGIAALSRCTLSRYVSRWTSPTRQLIQQEGAVLFHFEGDRIAEINVRFDVPGLRRLLATPAPSLH